MPLSPAATPYVQATSSPLAFIPLLTFTLPGLPVLRVANNTVDVISRGNTFSACAFEITLPNQDSEKLPSVRLSIGNADRRIVEYIRSLPQAPEVLLEVVTNADFDAVEVSVGYLKLQHVGYDSLTVTGNMEVDNWLSRRFGELYLPTNYPGLFMI